MPRTKPAKRSERVKVSEIKRSLRERVLSNPRDFCCSGGDRASCSSPSYPRDSRDPDVVRPGCKSFRCTRCKSTVGWCRGAHWGDHPADSWCDDCTHEVYPEGVEVDDGQD